MIRVPSSMNNADFESLKIQDAVFVAYRNNETPLRNEVFFEEHAVIFVLEGEKKFVSPSKTIYVRKGQLVFIRRGYYFMQETLDVNYKSLVFFFNEKLLKEFVGQNFSLFQKDINKKVLSDVSEIMVFDVIQNIQKFTETIFPFFNRKSIYQEYFLKLKLHELLLNILEIDNSNHFKKMLWSLYNGEKLDLDYLMNSYYLRTLSVAELARLSGRSLSVFKRDFHKQFQCSPAYWIKNKRLEYAYLILKNTTKSVNEISLEIGYESVSHFIKAFKEKYQTTPSLLSKNEGA
ncbi:MAG: helix-turn-helix transcriptional regulator [Pseudarcicella sp.]|nr:helix-turn-helix transcriptional regulator [Pseudarcicella sp.]MBP6409587.1 helix-turn-helix transcriptional regulator [Pseudarcicella sp.]